MRLVSPPSSSLPASSWSLYLSLPISGAGESLSGHIFAAWLEALSLDTPGQTKASCSRMLVVQLFNIFLNNIFLPF